VVICLECDADLHMAQLMPPPLTVSCFSKIQIGFTFLVPGHPGSTGQGAVKPVCVYCIVLLLTNHVESDQTCRAHTWRLLLVRLSHSESCALCPRNCSSNLRNAARK